mmetsp:Transcript_43418/g.86121  ORF Transcript_43418/g.86121 Transcript_43418/m.86121 type:complete len:312 (+) Transcript_43418:29-964(+)
MLPPTPGKLPRSRCFHRARWANWGASARIPETPLFLAGIFGGPFVIFILTPARNALTLASQDAESSIWQIYRNTFGDGLASGWVGGATPALAAWMQFVSMGPLYHAVNNAFESAMVAVLIAAVAETALSVGPQTYNAQVAFNQMQSSLDDGVVLPLCNPFLPYGPGALMQLLRNIVALSGIRLLSRPCLISLERILHTCKMEIPLGMKQFFADFLASMVAAVFSAPLHQCYNFAATSEAYIAGGSAIRARMLVCFIASHYISYGPNGEIVGLTDTLVRDLILRCAYVANVYSIFALVERTMVWLWHRKRGA